MPASLSKGLCLSSPLTKMDEEAVAALKMAGNKQGIVSILGSDDCETTKAASLRRTLSADMSSKKWLEQQGFSPMKRIASVAEFPKLSSIIDSSSSSSSDGEVEDFQERRGQFEIWSSIQEEEKKKKKKKKEKELENPGQFDIWTSILSQKAELEDSSKSATVDPTAAPYIHPLVKRASSLSEKSLEICTESLGSETGSDGFSSYPPSETGDLDQEEEQQEQQQQPQQQAEQQELEKEEMRIPKYSKKAPPRSFPPPLPSLSPGDGPSLRMQSHRENGRLVLEAVSVPTQNYFSAQRQDGRLLLTFFNSPNTAEDDLPPKEEYYQEIVEDDMDKVIGEWSDEEEFGESYDEEESDEEVVEEEEEEEVENFEKEEESIISKIVEMEIGVDKQQAAPKVAKTEVINVHRAAVMMNKLIRLANRNPTWPKRINEVIKFEDEEEEAIIEPTTLSKSFPVPPRTVPRLIPSSPSAATAATFNVYENCWRNKQPTTIFSTPPMQKPPPLKNYNYNNNNNNMFIFSKSNGTTTTLKANEQQQQQLLVLRGDKADYSVQMIKGCKDPRRSLLFWEPYCIATS